MDICNYVICADGAANRLYMTTKEQLPDLITGDLDSIKQETKHFYEAANVKVEYVADQDTTDMEKCLLKAIEYLREKCPDTF